MEEMGSERKNRERVSFKKRRNKPGVNPTKTFFFVKQIFSPFFLIKLGRFS
jgi:hypothetical protein